MSTTVWQLNWADWWDLFSHFMQLSLMAVGGAITTVSEVQRYVVDERGWLSHAGFSASIAIAQAAPGPNVLFIALMGWNIGLQGMGYLGAVAAMAASFIGVLLPSGVLTLSITRWMRRMHHKPSVRAFKSGMVPVTLALLIATGWILVVGDTTLTNLKDQAPKHWPYWLLAVGATLLVWRTKVHLLVLLAIGAVAGVVFSSI